MPRDETGCVDLGLHLAFYILVCILTWLLQCARSLPRFLFFCLPLGNGLRDKDLTLWLIRIRIGTIGIRGVFGTMRMRTNT